MVSAVEPSDGRFRHPDLDLRRRGRLAHRDRARPRDGRLVAESFRARGRGDRGPDARAARSRPAGVTGFGRGRRPSTRTSSRPFAASRPPTRSSPAARRPASRLRSTCRCSTRSPATGTPARSISTRPRRWPRTRRASWPSSRRPACVHAIYDGDTPKEERPAIRRRRNLILTNPDMLHVGLLPHHKTLGRLLREPPLRRRRRGPRLPRRLRLQRRQRPAPAAARLPGSTVPSPRFILTSATIANPGELAERLVGTPFDADRLRRGPAAPRDGSRSGTRR